MGDLIEYAKSELALIGCDDKCEAPNSLIRDNVLELVELFSKQGHSGYSAPHAITWKTQNGGFFRGSVDNIRSRQYIKLPFVPKTFYIDVIEEKVAPDDWEFRIKDLSQLEQVWEYFEKSDEFSTYKPITQEEINQRIKEREEKYSLFVSNMDATSNQPISES